MILSPFPKLAFLDNNGRPLVGGQLFVYEAGTATKATTYTDEGGGTPNTNPVILDFRGEANVWLDSDLAYKYVLAPRDDTDPPTRPIWSVDDITAPITIAQLTRNLIGRILFPQTTEEQSGGVTPVHYYIQPQNPMPVRYGAVGDGVTPDNTAFETLEDAYQNVMIDLGGLEYAVTTTLPAANIYFNGNFVITSDDAPRNTAYGWRAFANNTFVPFAHPSSTLDFASGNYNSAFGSLALEANTTGRRNTATGAEVLKTCTTGYYNTGGGALALTELTSGYENTAYGVQALQFTTTGHENVGIGPLAGGLNTSGNFNVYVGRSAGRDNTTGGNNTHTGTQAGQSLTTSNNSSYGYQALSSNVSGDRNSAFGAASAAAAANFSQVSAFGYRALLVNTANNNSAFGTDALISNTSGTKNAAFGYSVLGSCVTGINNAGFGDGSLILCTGDNNAGFGVETLTSLTTGDRCSALGYSSGSGITTADNCTTLGYNAQVTGSNQLQLGDSNTTSYAYGAVQNRSDARDKADVRDTVLGLDFIERLRPVDYRWDLREDYSWGEKDGSQTRARYHHGLIAQEVREAMQKLDVDFGGFQDHAIKGGKDVLSLGYTELIAPLIKAVQELSAKVSQLERERDEARALWTQA